MKWHFYACSNNSGSTGEFLSEALILAYINSQYDNRLFIELQEDYKFSTCCVHKLFGM